ncbi:hypothetical protein H9Q74_000240 [Fusarium xylarioides]|nr:hypothetical protein H9Q71_001201 [Fusarium xylarioides]KAG5829721.1 hypothetical protein H9Q74_000240 [Fusarium xylarioides]
MDAEDDTIFLFPVPDSEIGGFPRGKSPAEQKVLFEKGEVLTSKATMSMLYHGTLTPGGKEASLLIVDFRFLKEKNSDRFLNAKMRLIFRDLDGESSSAPIIHRIAPQDSFTIEPGVDQWKITQTAKMGVSGGYGGASVNGELGRDMEGQKTIKHSILLTGKKKLESGGFLGETMAIWSLDEDTVDCRGIPTVLRTAILLQRPPGKSFTIETQIETEANWMARLKTFFGRREQPIPLESIDVNPLDPKHIIVDDDEWLSAWAKKADESGMQKTLRQLNLQDELVLVVNEKLMANGSTAQ